MGLREALRAMRKGVDPEGKDPALDQMVVIGHSQGGLLTKMTVVTSGMRFWDNSQEFHLTRLTSTRKLAICWPARCS
jgi:hypothetical protein